MKPPLLIAFVMAFSVVCAVSAHAQEGQDAQTLARAAKNPFAKLTNLQFIYDANIGIGPYNKSKHVLNVQPVIPFALSADWSVITRTNIPLIAQLGQVPGENWARGSDDMQLAAFLSPSCAEQLVWGVGPVLQIPSATPDVLGQGKWAAGPGAGW